MIAPRNPALMTPNDASALAAPRRRLGTPAPARSPSDRSRREPAAADSERHEQCGKQAEQIFAPVPSFRYERHGERDRDRRDHGRNSLAERGDGKTCAEQPAGAVGLAPRERDAVPGERLPRE